MVRSTVKPETIWLRKIEESPKGLQAVLRVRWDVHTIEVEAMDGEAHTEYEYEEQEITETLPDTINSASALNQYFLKNTATLVERAKVATKMTIEPVQEDKAQVGFAKPEPWYEDIETVRAKVSWTRIDSWSNINFARR